jgi:hypothetical protein
MFERTKAKKSNVWKLSAIAATTMALFLVGFAGTTESQAFAYIYPGPIIPGFCATHPVLIGIVSPYSGQIIPYGSTVSLSAITQCLPSGSTLHWFVSQQATTTSLHTVFAGVGNNIPFYFGGYNVATCASATVTLEVLSASGALISSGGVNVWILGPC